MISRVYGKVNESNIDFIKDNEGRWSVTIPRNLSGTYYLELYAEDVAGNISYMATVLMEFDPTSFCTRFKVIDFNGNAEMKDFIDVFTTKNDFKDSVYMKNDYNTDLSLENKFVAEFKGGDNECNC